MSLQEIGPSKLKEFSCNLKVDEQSPASNPRLVLNFVLNGKSTQQSSSTDPVHNKVSVDNTADSQNLDERISFEMEPSVLDTFLEGLHRIQNQLSLAASKTS